jgi:hypothetical protein
MRKLYLILLMLFLYVCINAQTTVKLVADRDNTIYSGTPNNSNGSGGYFFAGRNGTNNNNSLQRALIHFNVGNIPAGAVINSATLTLYSDKVGGSATGIAIHKLSEDWGEGGSDALGTEGPGTAAQQGDATWNARFYPSTAWSTQGGTFVSTQTAVTSNVSAGTSVVVSTPALIADVQSWVNSSATNLGWIVRASDETALNSAKRFVSRNSGSVNQTPALSVTYSTTLPITLKGFSASLTKQNALLKWSTATELDNDHFEIEHSLNGKDFTSIAQVKANGTSTSEHAYTYLHENIAAGKHFYRITDIDKSGNKRYSQIITLSSGAALGLQLYPNPATSFISFTASSLLQGNEFTISSLTGQAVLKGIISQQQIDVQKLTSGHYFFIVKTKDGELLKNQFLKK